VRLVRTLLVRTVAAALIIQDSKLLVCQRKRGDSNALKWEFPGGKVEEGESAAEALVRELREELGVTAIEDSAPLQNLEFERFEWAGPAVLPHYDFLPADKELIDLLVSGSIRVV
jgi:8-oxo-dGTP diphosphatase